MPGQTSDDLLALFDGASLNRRYWMTFILMSAVFVFDFFDFLVVGYLLAVIGPQWHLTYGQSAVILYSGGIGAILGALVFGALSDAWGRKYQIVIGTFICAFSSGLIATIPEGAWWLFAILRFFVGVGLTAAVTPALTVVVELTPTRHRTFAQLLCGVRLGRRLSRPVDFGGAAWAFRLARRCIARLCRGDHRRPGMGVHIRVGALARRQGQVCRGARGSRATSGGTPAINSTADSSSYRRAARQSARPSLPAADVLGDDPDLGWLVDSRLWRLSVGTNHCRTAAQGAGPTSRQILCFRVGCGGHRQDHRDLDRPADRPPSAGRAVGLWGCGRARRRRILQRRFCRRAAAARDPAVLLDLLHRGRLFEPRTLHGRKLWVRMGARSSGLGQTANGVGKILGPFSLALIAGTSNIVSPKATEAAVFPAFLFLAFCMLLIGLSFLLLGVETHGRAITLGEEEEEPAPAPAVALGTEAR